MTLLESIVALAVFSVVVVGVASFVQIGGETSSLIHAQSRAQLDAERILRLVRDQIGRSGYPPSGGNLVYTPNPATNEWEIAYQTIQEGLPLVDISSPSPVASVPWNPTLYVIKWEHPTDSAVGAALNVDNDNDYIVDDGRLTLYRRVATDEPIGVLADDVRSFVVTEQNTPPRPRLRLQVTVERVLIHAVKNATVAAAVRAGGGPRVSHTADMWVVAPN